MYIALCRSEYIQKEGESSVKSRSVFRLLELCIPIIIILSFIAFLSWWGRYFSPKTNFTLILAYIPLLLISLITLFIPKKKYWSIATTALLIIEVLFFTLQPYYTDHQVKIRESILGSYINDTYPEEEWIIDKSDRNGSPYTFYVVFDNEKEIKYLYHVSKKGEVVRSGYSGSKEGEFKHFK